MHKITLGILFVICISLPYVFKLLEGIDNPAYVAIRDDIDLLTKKKEISYLPDNDYDGEQKNDPDKGQNVDRLISHAAPVSTKGRNLF